MGKLKGVLGVGLGWLAFNKHETMIYWFDRMFGFTVDCHSGGRTMLAYEFQTALKDGIIQIPAEIQNKMFGKVKVILMSEEVSRMEREESTFPYFAVDTTGYVWNREEANERYI